MIHPTVRYVLRAIEAARNKGGMIAGMPKVTINMADAVGLCIIADQVERLQARVAELEAATWTREQALIDVAKERERQDEKWGGANHDDDHTPDFWVQLIKNYAGWAQVMAGMDSPDKYRKRMIQVAALAVAAAGGMDRQLSAAQKQEQGQ